MKFQEVINVEKAKYLYNLSDSYWSTAIFSNEEENEDGNKYTQKDYIANCKKWLSKGIKKNSRATKNNQRRSIKKLEIPLFVKSKNIKQPKILLK